MATDATGTPTSPDNIPTYNTAVDNPSGKGSNAQMAAIQTALSARVSAPTGIASGEAMIWNGTAWARSSVTKLTASNIANGIAASQLSGYPSNGAQFLAGDGTWKAAGSTTYRKTTSKAVTNTITETDLLNGEISIGAGVLGTTGVARLTAYGDWIVTSAAQNSIPRFKLKLGATTLLDTNVPASAPVLSSPSRFGWKFVAEIMNLGASNTQGAYLSGKLSYSSFVTSQGQAGITFAVGEGAIWLTYGPGMTNAGALYEGFNTGTVDTTVSNVLAFTVINPSATATCETKLYGAVVEII